VTELLAPAWLREIHGTLGVHSQFVIEGHVRDRILTVDPGADQRSLAPGLCEALVPWLEADGYEVVLRAHPVTGVTVLGGSDENLDVLAARILADHARALEGQALSTEELAGVLRSVVEATQRCAVFVAETARLIPDSTNLTPDQQAMLNDAHELSLSAAPRYRPDTRAIALFNPVMWITLSEREMPDWFLASNERIRTVSVPLPELGQRDEVARMVAASFVDFESALPPERAELVARFSQQTQGMSLAAMQAIAQIALDQQLGMRGIDDAARAYRVGVLDSPWRQGYLRERIVGAEEQVGERVLGQRRAIRKSLDILIRSVTGMTGAQASPFASRPRGTLFFAGPTGVGKTELAKALTELVFGDERAYVRFDMSEFSEEHTAARLIGAPPGYTGFDSGGELTNALRERPFSLVLFDEIEKADGRILDKFLQILEDGRLTDGRGGTVYFTEALIVFTSNLGISEPQADGSRRMLVTPDTNKAMAETTIREGIERYFTDVLGRPELLNRLGDNIVVFDFIDADTGTQIFDLLLSNIRRRVQREHGVDLQLEDTAREQLMQIALANLSQGGRGIGSRLENALVNPLARSLFVSVLPEDSTMTVSSVTEVDGAYELTTA
jgi:energy-coupling factor transporter ATP-binding protein EcfA2